MSALTIAGFRVLPRLSGRAWGACFQSGIAALPFIGGQPLPPGYDLRGFVWRGYPSGRRASRAVGSPFRAKFPPEVCFWHGKTVNRGQDINDGYCSHGQIKPYRTCLISTGWLKHPIEGRGSHQRPAFTFSGKVRRPRQQPPESPFLQRIKKPPPH